MSTEIGCLNNDVDEVIEAEIHPSNLGADSPSSLTPKFVYREQIDPGVLLANSPTIP